MSSPTTLVCHCGRLIDHSSQLCPSCRNSQIRLPLRTGRPRVASADPSKSNTSPSDWYDSSRRSLDMDGVSRGRENSSASTIFTRAFTLEPDDDGDKSPTASVDMFPASVYRNSSRTSSRTNSSRSTSVYSLTPSNYPVQRSSGEVVRRPSELYGPSPTPTPGVTSSSQSSAERAYSPMVAGFARLRRQDGTSSSTGSTSSAGDNHTQAVAALGARMFAGPA